MTLEWNVYVKDMNCREIKSYNIFNHGRFTHEIEELIEQYGNSKEEFAKEVDLSLRYYFWSKCEWETVITSWPPHIIKEELDRLNKEMTKEYPSLSVNLEVEEKIDVYQQVMLNWDRFIDYLWGEVKNV